MTLLKKSSIPPYPQFYELMYTYATGVNSDLNSRINEWFANSQMPSVDTAEKLYEEFLRLHNPDERLKSLSNDMSENIESVSSAVSKALEGASSYSGTLAEASGNLAGNLSEADLKKLVEGLLSDTQKMQESNQALENQLEASRTEMAELQRNLDEVRQESMLDPLTKIHNRKSFDQGLDRAIAKSRDSGEPLALIMLDIDHFKAFNDNYGHQTGDQVLRLVAMTMKSTVRGQNIAARYGGEEFAAVLPQTDIAGATKVAEALRAAIQAKELLKRSTNQKLGRITASFGISLLSEEDSAASLIERADACLYAAKRAGRNRVLSEISPEVAGGGETADSNAA